MTNVSSTDWRRMADAPRDGQRILVAVHASEQGPAQMDVVAWVTPAHGADEAWLAADSRPDLEVTYAEGELAGWMPLPDDLPPLRSGRAVLAADDADGEQDGSSI